MSKDSSSSESSKGRVKRTETELKGNVRYVKGSPVVLLTYDELKSGTDLSDSLEAAYGPDGLGLLVVRGIPGYQEMRAKLLPMAREFAQLDEETKEKYVVHEGNYSFGWSHGKENLTGKPDLAKGSYYNNPMYDRPIDDEDLIKKFPSFCHPNVWPKKDLPELEKAFKALGQLIVETACLLARHCDTFCALRYKSYEPNKLYNIIRKCRFHKARLLHYFPPDQVKQWFKEYDDQVRQTPKKDRPSRYELKEEFKVEEFEDSWCGWHNDHGSLTGLCRAMFLDEDGKEVDNPDPRHAGLYIKNRKGDLIKATIPVDCLAYQIGESQQIHSGGALQATPHCVRASFENVKGSGKVSRNTFALFMEPEMDFLMNVPEGVDPEKAKYGSSHKFLPSGVPPIGDRWENDWDFGEFTKATLMGYYPDEEESKQYAEELAKKKKSDEQGDSGEGDSGNQS